MAFQIRRIETIVPRKAEAFGGKARNIAALSRAGFPVPAAWALSVDACESVLASVLDPTEAIAALVADVETEIPVERLRAITEKVLRAPFPVDLERGLKHAFDELRRAGAKSLAVRSSSTQEDDHAASAAGIHTTILHVTTEDELLHSVRKCWASLYDPRAISYLRSVTATPRAAIGIVIQAMVPADVSGVLFTVNPLTGDPSEVVVNASFGLGTLVVDGRVSPDFYRIDKASGFVRDRVVGDKRLRSRVSGDRIEEEAVDEHLVHSEALSQESLDELLALGKRIEQHFGDARDVEWAFSNGTLYVLQARPVTTVSTRTTRVRPKRREPHFDPSKLVWSNVNVGEALPGVATPLTWSVLSNFSDLGFRKAFGAAGCVVPKDAELIGAFRGRLYLNLTEMLSICAQVPGLRASTLLSWAGGGESDLLESQASASRSHTGFLLRLPFTAARFLRENVMIDDMVGRFEGLYESERGRIQRMDLRILSPAALAATLRDVESLLDEAGSVLLTCYGNLLLCVVALRAALKAVAPDRFEDLERGLTSGLADLESAAPGLALWHIAEMLRVEPEARDKVLSTPASDLRVESLPDGATRRALERFLDAYGGRGAREAEIAEPRWREDPTLLFVTLRIHLEKPEGERGEGGPLALERRLRVLRDESEAELARSTPLVVRSALRHLLGLVQRFLRLRERLRSHVTEVIGLFRAVALEAGHRIHVREGTGADSAFFLAADELKLHLRGHIPTVGALVRARRTQFLRDRALPDPPDTFVGFPPPIPADVPRPDELVGLAASSGHVRGRARVLSSPHQASEFRSGEILVAPYADVGWSPLFLVAKAVVTDLGGPLSHAAIVAREYGVPAVMNVKVGTRVIRTGDLLEVDGHRGIVKLLDESGGDARA
jgi:phosphohistidine swiveling domain-containing protein